MERPNKEAFSEAKNRPRTSRSLFCRQLWTQFCPPALTVPGPTQLQVHVALCLSSCQKPSSAPAPSLGQHGSPVPGARCSQSCWPSAPFNFIRVLAESTSAVRACIGCLYWPFKASRMATANKQLPCIGGHGTPSPSASPWEEFCSS